METDRYEKENTFTYPFGRSSPLRDRKPNNDKPENAIVREIDFEVPTAGVLRVFYSRFSKDVPVANDGELKGIIALLHEDRFPSWEQDPPKQSLPFDSELSVYNDRWKYIIFLLRKNKNWQFAQKHWPITIGEKYQAFFYDAARADSKGIPDYGDDEDLIREGCRVAYVMAAADEALSTAGAYRHSINLHIDLINDVKDKNGVIKKCYLPIIVDPDIRFPGGSGEP